MLKAFKNSDTISSIIMYLICAMPKFGNRRLVVAFLFSISSTFYEQLLRQYSFDKKLLNQTVKREKLRKTL